MAPDAALLRRGEAPFQHALGTTSHNPSLARATEDGLVALFLPEPAGGFVLAKATSLRARTELLAAIRRRALEAAASAVLAVLAGDRIRLHKHQSNASDRLATA